MRISGMNKLVRPIALLLLPALVPLLLHVEVFGQDRPGGEGRIENARWKIEGDVVVITFDLIADAELTHDIKIYLTRESDRSFRIDPASLSGDFGKVKRAGSKREIRWAYKDEVAADLKGDDYYFVINVTIMQEGGSNLLYYLLGGAVLVGGGTAAVLLGSKKTESTTTPANLPNPPTSRPAGQ
jgi:hypothetical protein